MPYHCHPLCTYDTARPETMRYGRIHVGAVMDIRFRWGMAGHGRDPSADSKALQQIKRRRTAPIFCGWLVELR